MSNAETIAKLNDALSKLIKAYEELQDENNGLNKTIEDLEAKIDSLEINVLELEEEKSNLESDLSELNQNKKEDGSNITTMLGKIENLLGRKSNDTTTAPVKVEEVKVVEDEPTEPSLLEKVEDTSNKEDEDEIKVQETSSSSLDDIRLDKPGASSFGNTNNSFGSNSFNSSFPDVNAKKDDEDEDSNSTLDLNRMASLLNGMNKR